MAYCEWFIFGCAIAQVGIGYYFHDVFYIVIALFLILTDLWLYIRRANLEVKLNVIVKGEKNENT